MLWFGIGYAAGLVCGAGITFWFLWWRVWSDGRPQ